MARPLKGKQARKLVSIRLEPSEKELLINKFGGVQAALDYLLSTLEIKKPRSPKTLGLVIKQAQKELDDWITNNLSV